MATERIQQSSVSRKIAPASGRTRAALEEELDMLGEQSLLSPEDLVASITNLILQLGYTETKSADGVTTRTAQFHVSPYAPSYNTPRYRFETIEQPEAAGRPRVSEASLYFKDESSYKITLEDGEPVSVYRHYPGGHTVGGVLKESPYNGALARLSYGRVLNDYKAATSKSRFA